MTDKEAMMEYLNKIHPVIERLTIDLLINRPTNLVPFLHQWLDTKGDQIWAGNYALGRLNSEEKVASQVSQEFNDIDIPKFEIKETANYEWNSNPIIAASELEIEDKPQSDRNKSDDSFNQMVNSNQPTAQQTPANAAGQHNPVDTGSEEHDEDEDIIDEEQFKKNTSTKTSKQVSRSSVSAEAYGAFNQKKDFVPQVIEKDQETKQRILKRLLQAFMFQSLEDKERDIVLNAMQEVKVKVGEYIIKQGDDGDVLYVVDQGVLDCYVKLKEIDENGEFKQLKVKTYEPGSSFGELALLYNAPRAASIKAIQDSVLFSLDRECFNAIVKDSAQKRREQFEDVLQKVDLLKDMEPYERTQLCDGLKVRKCEADEYVITEGDRGDFFYFVESGNLKAYKEGIKESICDYGPGTYFGELALIKDIPRQASVQSVTQSNLLYLDKDSFQRLLGPISEILKRNEDRYKKYIEDLLQGKQQ